MADVNWKEEPVLCPNSQCSRPFDGLRWHIVNEVKSLMLAGAKVFTLTMVCPSCGNVFYWNYSYREMRRQTEIYLQLLAATNNKDRVN